MSSPQGRFAADAALLDGQTVLRVADSAGKHLFVEFAGERFVHVHLGLIGKFDVHTGAAVVPPPGRPGPAAGWSPSTATRTPRRHRVVRRPPRRHPVRPDRAARSATRSWPGSDPTRCAPTPTPSRPGAGSPRSHRPIGDLLMDQEVLAGVGNVYRAEVLFRHRMHPLRPGQHAAARPVPGDVGRPGRADGRGGRDRPDRHGPARAHARGDGTPAAPGRPRRRGLRLPSDRTAVPRVWQKGTHGGARGAKLVLVPGLPAAVPISGVRTREGRHEPAPPPLPPSAGASAARVARMRRGTTSVETYWLVFLVALTAALRRSWSRCGPHFWPMTLLVVPMVLAHLVARTAQPAVVHRVRAGRAHRARGRRDQHPRRSTRGP